VRVVYYQWDGVFGLRQHQYGINTAALQSSTVALVLLNASQVLEETGYRVSPDDLQLLFKFREAVCVHCLSCNCVRINYSKLFRWASWVMRYMSITSRSPTKTRCGAYFVCRSVASFDLMGLCVWLIKLIL
jgi:hypothetical protein